MGSCPSLRPIDGHLEKEERRALEAIDPVAAAERLEAAQLQVRDLRARLASTRPGGEESPWYRPTVAMRAAQEVERLCGMLEGWFGFTTATIRSSPGGPSGRTGRWSDAAGTPRSCAADMAGAGDEDALIGDPVGREALLEDLAHSLIPDTPEELMDIARRERDWCQAEMRRAARDMGLGDDWRAALERVKDDHVPPGAQPGLVRDLAREAIRYVEENDLVTVPPLAAETWRVEMMSPERQKVNPFFLGGEVLAVSFPTSAMEHAQKRMSLRGNNRHFARATVQHELIPGHHLQAFSQARFRPYRRMFYTPFWTEGWTLHWEMLLWDRGFARTPEERHGDALLAPAPLRPRAVLLRLPPGADDARRSASRCW